METYALEPAGLTLLLASWLAVSALVLFCIRRVLRSGDSSDEE